MGAVVATFVPKSLASSYLFDVVPVLLARLAADLPFCVIRVAFVSAVYSSLFLEPRRAVEFTASMKARLLGYI